MVLFLKKTLPLILLLSAIGGRPHSALAWPPELAPELEFTNRKIENAWAEQPDALDTSNSVSLFFQKKFKDAVMKKCPECTFEELKDKYQVRKYRIHLPINTGGKNSTWYFDITLDPAVLEITAQPTNDISPLVPRMSLLIWQTAKAIGLKLDTAGHLNFGVKSAFGKDALLFRNFFFDFLNHPCLTEGLLGYKDADNAPHPERLLAKQRRALLTISHEFDGSKGSIEDFAKRIYKEVYYRSTSADGTDGEPPEKYHALNISSLVDPEDKWPRVELRTMPMQRSPEDLELLYKLFAARVRFLKEQKEAIPYTAHLSFRKQTPSVMVKDFYRYVTECGLDWKNYRRFVLYDPKFAKTLKAFEKKWKGDEGSATCPTRFHGLGH